MSQGPQGERGEAGPPGPPGPTRVVRVRRNAKTLGVFAVLAVALGIVLGITVLGSGVAATSRPASVDEHVASAGVYEVTVVIMTRSRSANLRVTIGSVARHVLLSDHRAVVRQQVTVTGREVPIRASASNASPTITASSRRLASLASSAPAPAGAPVGVETGVNVTSNVGFTSPQVLADISASRPAWVRVFMQWSDLEPQQGSYDPGWISLYQKFFAALPSGTQVDVDVVGAPAWANGGSDSIATPPSNPADFAASSTTSSTPSTAGSPPGRSGTRRPRRTGGPARRRSSPRC
jgi:hypothetical protein